jgi:Mg-chelatase subunit ChlD
MKKIIFGLLLMLMVIPASLASIIPTTISDCIETYDTDNQEVIRNCGYRPEIDVVFVIDSTGSMNDEIRTVKTHLTKIIKEVKGGQPSPYLRVGVIAYRDYEDEEDEYLYQKLELTDNIDKALRFIKDIEANGGGDLPEAVEYGLHVAINKMNWNDVHILQNQESSRDLQTKKLIFLIGDAAPHGEGSDDNSYYQGSPFGFDYKDKILEARDKDITIYTVSGSGIDDVGVKVFKEIARKTGGDYSHLDYQRRDIQEYYEEEGFSEVEVQEYVAQAKEDVDFEKRSNSILTNTLGIFAKKSMQAEAMDMGVNYDEPVEIQQDGWVEVTDITGSVVEEPESDIGDFFRKIFDKLVFWK